MLGLTSARAKDLQAHTEAGRGDLATCLERVLKSGGPPAHPIVTLDEVDDMLLTLAGRCRSSSSRNFKAPPGSSKSRDDLLGNIFKRLYPEEGKWLVRLILKDLSPLCLNASRVLRSFHFLLPDVLRFQDDLEAAIGLLKGSLSGYPHEADPRSQRLHRQTASAHLKPVVCVKVGRPTFFKARSIDHCINMLGEKRWVVERKYDGEYCEIHIDLSRSTSPMECITIFSKSGKDSTEDRKRLHQTLVDCLRLGQPECKIKSQAILLGELVVYSDQEGRIMPFDKIRKHVTRAGRFLGTDEDSYPSPHERLAIVFFDLLLLDNEVIMAKPLEERRMWLREVYRKIGGRTMSSEWKIVDFADAGQAKKTLVQQFAASIAERCEGLVLKPCGSPYFTLDADPNDGVRAFVKLKKDYMSGLGDEADFAVIGGSFNAQHALKSGLSDIKWTEFYVGCLVNKADVLRFDARPRFKTVGSIQSEFCIPRDVLHAANALGKFCAEAYKPNEVPTHFDIESDPRSRMETIFGTPFVFEVLGSGFVKAPNSNFMMLRHARVKKLHEDRTWKECISMQELVEQAAAAQDRSGEAEGVETIKWIEKLESKCKKKSARQRTCTPRSRATTTPSTTPNSASRGKRSCEELGESPCWKRRRKELNGGGNSDRESDMAVTKPTPLSDITNRAPRWSHTQSLEGKRCASVTCPFTTAVVYLAPCVARTPYIKCDLLITPHPGVVTVSTLAHWERESVGAYSGAETEVVSESPAFVGHRKVVLVEGRRLMAVRETVRWVVELNSGVWRERVEVWDWRVLEGCGEEKVLAVEDGKAKGHFLGATMFDGKRARSRFISEMEWLQL